MSDSDKGKREKESSESADMWAIEPFVFIDVHRRTDVCSCYRTKNRSISVELR
jgi:hypothetical protein